MSQATNGLASIKFNQTMCRLASTAIAMAATSSICWPQTPNRLEQVAASMAKRGLFSGSVLVARDDQVLLSQAYGLANATWVIPNSPDTRYQLASITKQFTAAAVLRLVDQGKVRLDDPVAKYLADAPAAWAAITVRNLLNHTSGIVNFTDAGDFGSVKARPVTPPALLRRFRDQPLEFAPGTDFHYSNSNYALLAMLIENVTGKSYADDLHLELFAPLGMENSGVASSDSIVPRLASGYRMQGDGLRPAHFSDLSWPFGAGDLYSTTGDLLKWQRALYGGQVLSAAALKEMTTPVRNNYAMGLGVDNAAGNLAYFHSGGNDGVSTWLRYEPATHLTVVVLGNLDRAESQKLAGKLGAVANGNAVSLPEEHRSKSLPSKQLAGIVGSYQISREDIAWVILREGALWVRLPGQAWCRLEPQSAVVFYAPDIDVDFNFALDSHGKATAMTVPDLSNFTPWVRASLPPPSLAAQPVFVRGTMNQWSARNPLSRGGDGLYRATIDLPAGAQEFKIGSQDWSIIDLGARNPANSAKGYSSLALRAASDNIPLQLAGPSRCVFTVDARDIVAPLLSVSCRAAP